VDDVERRDHLSDSAIRKEFVACLFGLAFDAPDIFPQSQENLQLSSAEYI